MLPVYRVRVVLVEDGEPTVLYVEAASSADAVEAARRQLQKVWGRREPLPVVKLLDVRRRSR